MSDEKISKLTGDVRVLEKGHEVLTKHHDKLFDVLDGIKTDLSRLVTIEERQLSISGTLSKIESHASKQGQEIQDIKDEQHEFELRLQSLESESGSNTEVRRRWNRIMERVIGSLIILAMGAFIALKQ